MSPQPGRIVDLFAGPGGWSEGLRMLGLEDIGIEWDRDACATRRAAGHLTIRADVAQYPPEPFAGAWGLIASPPCPDWSTAGSRLGREGKTGWLVDVVPAWVEAVRPEWIACEQVPGALGVWEQHAVRYRELGYSVCTGKVNAADYGVGQRRIRAILLACAWGANFPEPTHAAAPTTDLFGSRRRWVSMSEALGREPLLLNPGRTETQPNRRTYSGDEPAPTIAFGHDAANWCWENPAPTLSGGGTATGGYEAFANADLRRRIAASIGPERVTVADALALQSFPADYPMRGSMTSQLHQIGNAVPPLLAAHLIAPLAGLPAPSPSLAGVAG